VTLVRVLCVLLGSAALAATPASGAGRHVATPAHPDCPGSIGGRTLDGPTDIGVPGAWIQGTETSVDLSCSYPGPAIEYSVHVAWITPANAGHEFYGCGKQPLTPATTFVSARYEAYAGINTASAGPDYVAAARSLLTKAERYAKPCAAAKPKRTRFTFGFRIAYVKLGLSAGSRGSFVALGDVTDDRELKVVSVQGKAFTFTLKDTDGKRHRFVVRYAGTGSYLPVKRRQELVLAAKVTESSGQCSGRGEVELTYKAVILDVCGNDGPLLFAAPKYATAWVKQG
jgi:hypothetical protein